MLRSILRTTWKSLLTVAIIATVIFLLFELTNPASDLLQIMGKFGGGIAALTGIAGVWGLLDSPYGRKRYLIQQIRNQVSDEAKSAISQLNAEGYLRDGSLRGVDLQGAHLAGVDLRATDKKGAHLSANLERVNLKQADLSSADMRGIVLKGANLDMANLENAKLMDADLTDANFVLTNIKGASLSGATLTGAKFAGEICDENTKLPDGRRWDHSVDWSKFGARNDLPDHLKIRMPRNTSQIDNKEDEQKRNADLRLLRRLWSSIYTDNIIRLDDDTQYRILSENLWTVFVLYLKNRHNHPELHFLNQEVESAFEKFDEALEEFLQQLVTSASLEDWHGERVFKPHYKTIRAVEYEIIKEKEREWEQTIDLLLQVIKQHGELVRFLRHQFPSFNFEDVSPI